MVKHGSQQLTMVCKNANGYSWLVTVSGQSGLIMDDHSERGPTCLLAIAEFPAISGNH